MNVQSAKSASHFSQDFLTGSVSMPRSLLYPFRPRMHFPNQRLTFGAGLHQALHPLPARNEGGGPRRGETNKKAPPLPSPLLHPMEEKEKPRSFMQPCLRGGLAGRPLLAVISYALRLRSKLEQCATTRPTRSVGKKNALITPGPAARSPGSCCRRC